MGYRAWHRVLPHTNVFSLCAHVTDNHMCPMLTRCELPLVTLFRRNEQLPSSGRPTSLSVQLCLNVRDFTNSVNCTHADKSTSFAVSQCYRNSICARLKFD